MRRSRTFRPNHTNCTWSPERPHTRFLNFHKIPRLLTVAPSPSSAHHTVSLTYIRGIHIASTVVTPRNIFPQLNKPSRTVSQILLWLVVQYRFARTSRLACLRQTTCAHPLSSTEANHNLKQKPPSDHRVHPGRLDWNTSVCPSLLACTSSHNITRTPARHIRVRPNGPRHS